MTALRFDDYHRSTSYSDLEKGVDLKHITERAFGREGLGIVVVTGVPDIRTPRRKLFALGHRCARFYRMPFLS